MQTAPGEEDFSAWVFTVYGTTMMAIQLLENSVSHLYLLANSEPGRDSNASTRRQIKNLMTRNWRAYQHGTAGMKLNDAKSGIKQEISEEVYEDLDAFLKGPRNQLVHRFLIERLGAVEEGGKLDLIVVVRDLLEIHQEANRLRAQIDARVVEIVEALPESPAPPEEVQEALDDLARFAMLKQVPDEVVEKARARRESGK